MTPTLTELRAAAEAAIPGPWKFITPDEVIGPDSVSICDCNSLDHEPEPNGRYIALASPTTILALLDEVAALKAQLAEAEEASRQRALLAVDEERRYNLVHVDSLKAQLATLTLMHKSAVDAAEDMIGKVTDLRTQLTDCRRATRRETVENLHELLRNLEWSASEGQLSHRRCPECRALRDYQHQPDCRLMLSIQEAAEAEEGEGK